MRFGVLVHQDAPPPVLAERFRAVEELGFDLVFVCDHTADYRNQAGYWLDGWTVLAAAALQTARVRVGTLVSNPILRHPVVLAKAAVAVDHLSGGRLELGVGTGIAGFDHAAVGVPYWEPRERVARFAEYVEVLDGALRAGDRPYEHAGTAFKLSAPPQNPSPVQRPRPPITVAGQSPTVLRVAAQRAECWNTHGPFSATAEQILEVTRRQNETLDRHCETAGRDPRQLRRSLLLIGPTDAWASPDALERVVERFEPAGINEFVVMWPPDERRHLLERAAAELIPALSGD